MKECTVIMASCQSGTVCSVSCTCSHDNRSNMHVQWALYIVHLLIPWSNINLLRVWWLITQNLRPKSKIRNDSLMATTFFFNPAKKRDFSTPFVTSVWVQRMFLFDLLYAHIWCCFRLLGAVFLLIRLENTRRQNSTSTNLLLSNSKVLYKGAVSISKSK